MHCRRSSVRFYFNPLPPHGGRHNKLVVAVVGQGFQSTPSAWRETVSSYRITQSPVPFQSTPSAWRETRRGRMQAERTADFNPLPPHGGRHHKINTSGLDFIISIHSLRMEGDIAHWGKKAGIYISIHSLRMEGDVDRWKYKNKINQFQSTPSAWRETDN